MIIYCFNPYVHTRHNCFSAILTSLIPFQSIPLVREVTSSPCVPLRCIWFQSIPLVREVTRLDTVISIAACLFQSIPLVREVTFSPKFAINNSTVSIHTSLTRSNAVYIFAATKEEFQSIHLLREVTGGTNEISR